MSALDYLLSAADAFALFGFERKFDLKQAEVEERHAALVAQATALAAGEPEKGERVLAEIEAGRRVLRDPVARGRLLLDLLGGAGDPATEGLPPKFRARLAAEPGRDGAGTEAGDWAEKERRRLVAAASYLFRQLGDGDNGAVQRERRRQIREHLNAIHEIDRRRSRAAT